MPPTREGYGRAVSLPGKQAEPCVPVVELFEFLDPCPRVGRATAVVVVSGGRHGATHDLAQWGVIRSGRESVIPVGRLCWNTIVKAQVLPRWFW